MRNMDKRGGYSLVETVIALAVIVTVSITALSVVLSSASARVKTVGRRQALNFADNVWECFKAADDTEDFLAHVAFAHGVALTESADDGMNYTYESEKYRFTAQIRVRFSATERDEFEINVTDSDGEEIVSFSYRKGDGA